MNRAERLLTKDPDLNEEEYDHLSDAFANFGDKLGLDIDVILDDEGGLF